MNTEQLVILRKDRSPNTEAFANSDSWVCLSVIDTGCTMLQGPQTKYRAWKGHVYD